MALAFYGLLFMTFMAFFYLFYLVFVSDRVMVKQRLTDVRGSDYQESEELNESSPFSKRVIRPAYNRVLEFVGRVAPSSIRTEYDTLLNTSGLSQRMTYMNLIMIQFMLALLLMVAFVYVSATRSVQYRGFLVAVMGFMGFYVPILFIRQKAKQRKEQIQNGLPSFLDLVYVTVEAGLSFDMAIHRTMAQMKGPLVEEFNRTMEEIRHGRDRSTALKAMANRTQVDDVNTFVSSIVQAEELGANIGNVLRIQSTTMRRVRKQRAEEKAAKIPTKMTFPLVLLMFPSMFIVILGPAIINIMDNLMN